MPVCACCLARRRTLLLLAGAAAVPLAGCDQAGELGASLVPPEQEARMGEQAFAQMREEMPISRNRAYQRMLERVGERIVRVSEAEIPVEDWDFTVFADDQINAFALPGGNVGAFEGIIRLAGSDDLLAAVVGHEVGHVIARHSAQRVGTQQLSQLGIGAIAAILGAGGVADPQLTQQLGTIGAQYGILLPFSRNQELEADRIGMRLMARAGYDPEAAIAFWERMLEANRGGPPAFLSTHPAGQDRIDQLRAYLPEAMAEYRAA